MITLLGFSMNSYSQEIIGTTERDTLITITDRQVKVINCIISDYEILQKRERLLENIISADSVLISSKDSIISSQKGILEKKENYYSLTVDGLEKSLKKEKRKRRLYTTILGGVAIFLGVLAIK